MEPLNPVSHVVLHGRGNGVADRLFLGERSRSRYFSCSRFRRSASISVTVGATIDARHRANEGKARRNRQHGRADRFPGDRRALWAGRREYPHDRAGGCVSARERGARFRSRLPSDRR